MSSTGDVTNYHDRVLQIIARKLIVPLKGEALIARLESDGELYRAALALTREQLMALTDSMKAIPSIDHSVRALWETTDSEGWSYHMTANQVILPNIVAGDHTYAIRCHLNQVKGAWAKPVLTAFCLTEKCVNEYLGVTFKSVDVSVIDETHRQELIAELRRGSGVI